MSSFDDREKGFEKKFAYDAEAEFKATARRNRLLGEWAAGLMELENVGVNSCVVGETEVLGGERVKFAPTVKLRIWPYTISFETDKTTALSRAELESHLREAVGERGEHQPVVVHHQNPAFAGHGYPWLKHPHPSPLPLMREREPELPLPDHGERVGVRGL